MEIPGMYSKIDTTDAVLCDIARAVRDFFPPELWNRIDRVVRLYALAVHEDAVGAIQVHHLETITLSLDDGMVF